MPGKKSTETLMRTWARLLRAHDSVFSAVEAVLKARELPPVAWYDVLLELARDGGRALRPKELEQELLVAQYNLSRLLDRMEKAGLIERQACAGDARGQMIALTPKGRALQKTMWPHYRDAVEAQLQALDKRQLEELSGLLHLLIANPSRA